MDEDHVLETIRGYAAANRYELSDHAYSRMKQRNIRIADIHNALTKAFRCSSQQNERWRVDGPDMDGDGLTLIVAIEDDLIVVTLY